MQSQKTTITSDNQSEQKAFFLGREFKKPDETQTSHSKAFIEKQKEVHQYADHLLKCLQEYGNICLVQSLFEDAIATQYPIEKLFKLLENQNNDFISSCFQSLKKTILPHDYKKRIAKFLLDKLGNDPEKRGGDDGILIFGTFEEVRAMILTHERSARNAESFLETMRWIVETLCEFSCRDSLAIANYLMGRKFSTTEEFMMPAHYIANAARYGQLELVKAFVANHRSEKAQKKYKSIHHAYINFDDALVKASEHGHLQVAKYLAEQIKEVQSNCVDHVSTSAFMTKSF